jgi:RimJ/RimL family protein N-acetyltransferase
MIKLEPGEYVLAERLAQGLDFHLALRALLNGDSPGEIYLDDKESPGSLFAMTMKRCYLVGESSNRAFNLALKRTMAAVVFPRGIERGEHGFSLFYSPDTWEQVIPTDILDDIYPKDEHHYYRCRGITKNWRELLPERYQLVEVDEALVENDGLENHADLIDEIHSECRSTAEFLENRFGFCVMHGSKLITWGLSEYNSGERCEVGIATHPDHRRIGLATAVSLALVEKALTMDYHEVGWHCYAGNEGSVATALAAGFEKAARYPAYWVSYNRSIAMGVRGNQHFDKKEYQEATEWYIKAIEENDAPAWIYWITACAYANLDQREKAFEYLDQAINHGFRDIDHIKNSQYFMKWHGTNEWRALIERL